MVFDPAQQAVRTFTGLSSYLENQKDRQYQRQRQDRSDEMAEERHEAHLTGLSDAKAHRDRAFEAQQAQAAGLSDHRDRVFEEDKRRYDEGAGLRSLNEQNARKLGEYRDTQAQGAQITNEMKMLGLDETKAQQLQKKTFDLQKTLYDQIVDFNRIMADGKVTPDEEKHLANNPQADLRRMISDEYLQAGHDFEAIFSSMPLEEAVQQPKFLEAVSVLVPEWASKSSGKVTGIAALRQSDNPDEFVVGLNIDGDDRERPLTVNRSSDDSDLVKRFNKQETLKTLMSRIKQSRMVSTETGRNAFVHGFESQFGGELGLKDKPDYTKEANSTARKIYSEQLASPGEEGHRSFDDIYSEVKGTLDGRQPVSRDQPAQPQVARKPSREAFNDFYRGNITPEQFRATFGDEEFARAMQYNQDAEARGISKATGQPMTNAEKVSQLGITSQAQAENRIAEIQSELESMKTPRGYRGEREHIDALREELAVLQRAIQAPSQGSGRNPSRSAGTLYNTPEAVAQN